MKVKLVIVSPEVTPNEYEITLPTRIGRGHEAKLKLVHPLVSRLHCELLADGEQVLIRDLDSLNGTFVDQQRIDEDTPLASGATVMMGTVMFQVIYGKEVDRLPPPAARDLDKTVAAAGTVRQDTLNKIAKATGGPSDEELWEQSVEEPTAVSAEDESEGLAFLDEDDVPKQPASASAKPLQSAAKADPKKPAQPSPAKTVAKPPPHAADDEDVPFQAEEPADSSAKDDSADAPSGEKDDLDDFFNSIM